MAFGTDARTVAEGCGEGRSQAAFGGDQERERILADQPLSGIRVLDFTTLLPGPLAALILAEAGAEVIKIERPEGEELRRYAPRWGSESLYFALLNRGKKSVSLDLKAADALARLEPLIREADVVIEQFRPGVMARLGLDYERVRAIRPDIVYCSITGYGQSGPKAQVAGHDLNYISETGLFGLSHGTNSTPVVPPALVADIGGGSMPAVINILLALFRRDRTGQGAHLDIAMADAMFTFAWWAYGEGRATGRWPGNGKGQLAGGSPRYRPYPTRDGRLVAVAALEQKFWDRLCALVGLEPRLRDDSHDPAATTGALRAIFASHSAAEWERRFRGEDCAANVVRTLDEAAADPHFAERGLFDALLEDEAGQRIAGVTVPVDRQFRGADGEAKLTPALGADNALLDRFAEPPQDAAED